MEVEYCSNDSQSEEKYKFNIGTTDPRPFRPRRASNKTNSADARATLAPRDFTNPPTAAHSQGLNGQQLSFINLKREEAKVFYIDGNYLASIQTYNKAIQVFHEASSTKRSDILALLLSNRAACLLMVGAYDAAASNCNMALNVVSEANPHEPLSNDSGLLLKTKLYTRLGRAYLKLGDHAKADSSFVEAIRLCEKALRLCKEYQPAEKFDHNNNTIGLLFYLFQQDQPILVRHLQIQCHQRRVKLCKL